MLRFYSVALVLLIALPARAQETQADPRQLMTLLRDSHLAFETRGDAADALRIADILERQGHTGERSCRFAFYGRTHLDPSAPAQLRDRAAHHEHRCREQFVTLVVRVRPGHARIDLDGAGVRSEGRLPAWPRFVRPGKHSVFVAAQGYDAVRREVNAEAGSVELTIELESRYLAKMRAETEPSGPEPCGARVGPHCHPYIGWGIAGVSVGATMLSAAGGLTGWAFEEPGRPLGAKIGGLALLTAGAHVLGAGLMGTFWTREPGTDASIPAVSVAVTPERGGVTATWRF